MAAEENDSSEQSKSGVEEEHFATCTTMHGVYFFHTSRTKCGKILWMLLIIGMIAALISQVTMRIMDYFNYATSTDISEEFVAFLPFPAVTICSFNRYYMEKPDQKRLQAIHVVNEMITPNSVAYNKANNIRPDLNKTADFEENLAGNFNVKRMLDKFGFEINRRTMPACTFKYVDCAPHEFTPIYTWLGRCYMFNENNISRIQNIPGSGHGLSITINIQQEMFTEKPLTGNTEAGIKLQIHPQHETPDVGTYGISIPVGKKASIEMTQSDHNMMYEPWGRCDPNRENLKYFANYTLSNCMQECYTDAIIEHCGCRMYFQYWAEGHAPECSLEEMQDCAAGISITVQENYSAKDCECTIPCKFTTYNLAVSYSTYPNKPTANSLAGVLNTTEEYVTENTLQLEIYFRSMSYSTFSQSKKVSESSLLSDLGGQLGLWLGMSVVTAVEIFQFLTFTIARIRNPKSKTSQKQPNNVST